MKSLFPVVGVNANAPHSSSVATIIKFYLILTMVALREASKKTFHDVERDMSIILWCHVELSLAILANCLVAFRPFLKQVFDVLSKGSGNTPEKYSEIDTRVSSLELQK
jgi:hypothetical protein